MTNQEAIEILRNTAWSATHEDLLRTVEAVGLAISALQKQIPHRPYTNEIPYPYMPERLTESKVQSRPYMIVVQCPSCKRRLRIQKTQVKGDKYCPDCGQAIDWEDK